MGVVIGARMVWIGVALAVTGCAAKPAAVPTAPAAVALSYGMIVSIRPVVVATGRGADLLGAVGGVPAADVQSFSHEQQMEFIVLEDGTSQPISVIQGNELQFRLGDRVVLTRDGRTRLRRAGV